MMVNVSHAGYFYTTVLQTKDVNRDPVNDCNMAHTYDFKVALFLLADSLTRRLHNQNVYEHISQDVKPLPSGLNCHISS